MSKVSKKTKEKMRQTRLKLWADPVFRERMKERNEKIRQANLNNPVKYWLGKNRSEETKEKIRIGNLGKKHTDETKREMSLKHLGMEHSLVSKLKMSERKKGKPNPKLSGSKNHFWKGGVSKVKGYYSFKARERKIRKYKAEGSHTLIEWEALKMKYRYMCLCCKQSEPEIKLTVDHIIPLVKNGSDSIENIQPLCHSCNSRKYINIIDFRVNSI